MSGRYAARLVGIAGGCGGGTGYNTDTIKESGCAVATTNIVNYLMEKYPTSNNIYLCGFR